MSAIVDIEFKIARLDLRPGDILVVKCPKMLPFESRHRLMELMQGASGGHRVLVLDGGLDLAVLTAAEIAERTATQHRMRLWREQNPVPEFSRRPDLSVGTGQREASA